jgi:hypothetical protein
MSDTNPFLSSLVIPVVVSSRRESFIRRDGISSDDGSLVVGAGSSGVIDSQYLMDAGESCKVYRGGLSRACIEGLPCGGRVLFDYVVMHLGRNRDRIRLSPSVCCGVMGISRKTFYRGIGDLIRYNVIARRSLSVYWVNPAIVYNGNRVRSFPGCVSVAGASD